MNLKIIWLGKNKDAWISDAIKEYSKRLGHFTKLEIVQLADVSIKIAGTSEAVIAKESKLIEAKLCADDYVVVLDELGEEKTSLEFSRFLINISEGKRVVFVIGGVFGISDEIKNRADICLSLSRLTFTHRMARVILIEQIYRAMMIAGGKNYHI